ncbi:hypothetical protein [Halobacterium jilantaiense]|uniref:Uncharacterized protein n=1 Tax=Halobacterium jilantaiense TaxID=355548 RepID=A0A1I0NVQ8_9EURY|nr:hypothetical protein [Halobacterium jilantaiense]SEW05054.1 hypothetical protein SAMN04487945_1143 [Halobacterium jilantaiense]
MKRRAFLATAGLVATTGCLGRAVSDGDEPATRDESTTQRDSATRGDGDALADHGRSCPAIHDSADATVCAGEGGDRGVSFGQNADRLTSGEVLELTLVTEDTESVGLNPYDWGVYREKDGGWARVDQEPTIEPWVVLASGERLQWRVGVGDATVDTDGDRVYGGPKDLDPGEYAFAATADIGDATVSLVAPFTVE